MLTIFLFIIYIYIFMLNYTFLFRDILKLTAQFVARNGRQFMTALSQREQRNYQFDFLRPNHSLFNYFTKLVEQYTKVLIPPKNLNEKLRYNVDNKYQIL